MKRAVKRRAAEVQSGGKYQMSELIMIRPMKEQRPGRVHVCDTSKRSVRTINATEIWGSDKVGCCTDTVQQRNVEECPI